MLAFGRLVSSKNVMSFTCQISHFLEGRVGDNPFEFP